VAGIDQAYGLLVVPALAIPVLRSNGPRLAVPKAAYIRLMGLVALQPFRDWRRRLNTAGLTVR